MDLKTKYSILFALIVLSFLSVFSYVVYFQFRNRLMAQAEGNLLSYMEHEWQHLASHGGAMEEELSNVAAKQFHLRVYRDLDVVFDSFPKKEIGDSGTLIQKRFSRRLGSHEFTFQGFYNLSPTLSYIAALRRLLALACLVAAALLIPLSWWLATRVLAPFRRLSAKTAELTAERLAFRFEPSAADDEYGRLVESFNRLLDRLEKSFHQVKRFAANASHELRTPLAVIHGETQFALRKPRPVEEYVAALENIEAQTQTLKRIIHQLLFLADLERFELSTSQDIDVPKVIEETVRTLRAVRPSAHVEVDAHALFIRGNEELFASVVNNLVENALKYCAAQVRLSYTGGATGFVMRVEDDGPGIPEAERESVFEVFRKGISASAALRVGASHGLGLSIVRACVLAAKGNISLGDSRLGGLAVEVRLPG